MYHIFTSITISTRRNTQKGEASPALVPAEQSLPTYTLFARCDNPPNISGVRHMFYIANIRKQLNTPHENGTTSKAGYGKSKKQALLLLSPCFTYLRNFKKDCSFVRLRGIM